MEQSRSTGGPTSTGALAQALFCSGQGAETYNGQAWAPVGAGTSPSAFGTLNSTPVTL